MATTVSVAVDARAQEPAVADSAGDAVSSQTQGTDRPDEAKRSDGWKPGLAIGATVNLNDARSVVGQQEGTTVSLGGVLDGVVDYNSGKHEWRNVLAIMAGTARTPTIDEFVKTSDKLTFETTYLLHVYESFGPFTRFGLDTSMFPSNDVRASAVDYEVAMLDGTTDEFTGRRLRLTDAFQPLTLKESLGVFWQPVRMTRVQLETRAGIGAQETLIEGGLTIDDDDSTDTVELKELDDTFAVGGELLFNVWGFFDEDKRASYSLGIGVLFPFVTSSLADGDERGLGELTTVEGSLALNAKLFDWASLGYRLDVDRNPLLLDEFQVTNNLLLTIGAAFGSKAPVPPPKKTPCDCAAQAGVQEVP